MLGMEAVSGAAGSSLKTKVFVLWALLATGSGALAASELWRSPLHEMSYVQIEKRLRNPLLDAEQAAALPPSEVFEALPAEILGQLGPRAVDYDSFTATYLPAAQAEALMATARSHGLVVVPGIDRGVRLPWHSFEAGNPATRTAPGFPQPLRAARALPRLFLTQFAYPVQDIWLAALDGCGIQRIATFQERALLVRADNLGAILSCGGISSYLSWIDSYRSTDRVSPELLQHQTDLDYQFQYILGTDLQEKRRGLGRGLQAHPEPDEIEERMGFLRVRGKTADLAAFIDSDPDLLSVSVKGEGAPSDERQGQIVAGNHNGIQPTGPGYRTWLSNRGLLTASNRPIVGLIDTGYDDGLSPYHRDLENPTRLIAPVWVPPNGDPWDVEGHGTMVAGIIAGEGATGTGAKDGLGYFYGSGIAPNASVVATRPAVFILTRLEPALNYCRSDVSSGTDRAHVINNSYNNFIDISGIRHPDTEYDEFSMFFDDKTLDGSSEVAGLQATTLIFSAGNFAYDYSLKTVRRDSVASPATAKNVITVGSTASYRPSNLEPPPLDCVENSNGSRPPNQDANHIARMGLFSGRGKAFNPAPSSSLANTIRIKPDLVAPGIRVFSTVPWESIRYTNPVGCTQYYPTPPANKYYTYGTGTSFSAPVVSGVAALKRKWFLDRGTDPSPSLLKAALIATADSLGGYVGNDHRPSSNSGWGRVSLARATDSRARFYVKDNQALAVGTGQQRTWTRTIDSSSSDTFVVLVWSDPKSDVIGGSQAPLKNNLSLTVEELGLTFYWRGNNFRENIMGEDNGFSYRFTSPAEIPLIDFINNVEAVFIPANTLPPGQKITIKITGENVTTSTQKFAIYAYNVQLSQ